MNLDELISGLEKVRERDILTGEQRKDIQNVLTILQAHQVLSEGENDGAEHKLDRVVAKLQEERTMRMEDGAMREYTQGYKNGLTKAISVIKEEMTDE